MLDILSVWGKVYRIKPEWMWPALWCVNSLQSLKILDACLAACLWQLLVSGQTLKDHIKVCTLLVFASAGGWHAAKGNKLGVEPLTAAKDSASRTWSHSLEQASYWETHRDCLCSTFTHPIVYSGSAGSSRLIDHVSILEEVWRR